MELTSSIQDRTLLVTLSGQFTFGDSKVFRPVLDMLDKDNIASVVLNLAPLEFVDSAALGMLLLLRDETGKRKQQLILRGPQGQVRKIFDVARFNTLFSIEH